MGDDHVVIAAINSVALFNAMIINDNTRASDSAIEYYESNNLATTFCKNYTFEACTQDSSPDREALVDTVSCEKSDCDNAAPKGFSTHRIEFEISQRRESVEPDTATSQVGMFENINFGNLGLESSYDPVYASTLDECSVKAAVNFEKTTSETVFLNSQDEAENTDNETIEVIFENENPISEVIRPSSSHYNIGRFMRSSRDIHPMDVSPFFVSGKRRHALSFKPSFGVQPIMSQTFTLSVVIKIARDSQTVSTRVVNPGILESWSSENDSIQLPESRKRAAVKQILETAKRTKGCNQHNLSLVLTRPYH